MSRVTFFIPVISFKYVLQYNNKHNLIKTYFLFQPISSLTRASTNHLFQERYFHTNVLLCGPKASFEQSVAGFAVKSLTS